MSEPLIVGVDPGETTGIARCFSPRGSHFESLQLEGFTAVCQDLSALASTVRPTVFVCEQYTIGAGTLRMTRQPTALHIIGVLRWLTTDTQNRLVMQKPADAKTFATDDRLKRWDMYRRGQPHANDAARHLALYLARTHKEAGLVG